MQSPQRWYDRARTRTNGLPAREQPITITIRGESVGSFVAAVDKKVYQVVNRGGTLKRVHQG